MNLPIPRNLLARMAGIVLLFFPCAALCQQPDLAPNKSADAIRIATFNVSMNRSGPNRLTEDLQRGDAQIKAVAAVIRAVRPDIILLNEIDYSTAANNALLFEQKFLSDAGPDLLGNGPHPMPYHFSAPVNTGEPSGIDLNRNGRTEDPEDAWGFGRFPGQYGMTVLSRFEIDARASRTFQKLLWSELPDALRPVDPSTKQFYYDDVTWGKLRLPSKSLWDIVIRVDGTLIHLLASHPTPPAFDGPEDRNGCRNHDEIRLLLDYISPPSNNQSEDSSETTNLNNYFWTDDQGRLGKLPQPANFVIAGDLNADPVDGDNRAEAIRKLLAHPSVNTRATPQSSGAILAASSQAKKNAEHNGNPAFDTADFNDQVVGNLRVDYVLPSSSLTLIACGVVWPTTDDNEPKNQEMQTINTASDHHLVWIDVQK